MNEWVNNANECPVTSWIVFCATPWNHRHHWVMIQMQERHLIILFPKYKENRVEQFCKLCNEVHVAAARFLLRKRLKKIYYKEIKKSFKESKFYWILQHLLPLKDGNEKSKEEDFQLLKISQKKTRFWSKMKIHLETPFHMHENIWY